ncbi:hypothetical protein PCANC_13216 [Puccinia coronata f. sp. avenae]|uniref:Uncharacterized protein n=1 Tax=Puccinia coronata f. sp. avenae TaxID=200324 RepID=A0A2N5V026_9BASI|nr:hypothetical protein PCANC_13216 [Puccinia coronata f. sp. avenae]
MAQQLELLVLVPATACSLWPHLERSVSATDADAPNSCSCWSQQLRPIVPAAGALLELLVSQTEIDAPNSWSCRSQQLELLVSASETDGSSCWNRLSWKLRPMQIPAAEAIGLSK